jgi:hypothetical protein
VLNEAYDCYRIRVVKREWYFPVIAAFLGHANGDMRMVTKHHAHLSDSYISDTLESRPSFAVKQE